MIDRGRRRRERPPCHPTSLSRLVFFLPLGVYWLLAILTAFHPRPLSVLVIFALPLVLTVAAVVGRLAGRA